MIHLWLYRNKIRLGELEAPISPPLDPTEFAEELELIRRAAEPPLPGRVEAHLEAVRRVDETFLRQLGHRLYERAIKPVEDALRHSDGPLVLHIADESDTPPRLADLPWELLHDGRDWLARRRGILRAIRVKEPLPLLPAREGPLRVLIAMASPVLNPDLPPDHQAQPYVINLDEQAGPFRALDGRDFPARIALRLHVDPDLLRTELGEGYDVFHFLGHGNVGMLALEDRYGREHPVDGDWLRERIPGSGIRLGVFQSCLTAAEGPEAPGVARMLLEAGVPAALAMAHSISVPAAEAFFREFYRELARGRDVAEAVRRARLAVADAARMGEARPWEWATPVLLVNEAAPEEAWRLRVERGKGRAVVEEFPRIPFTPSRPPEVQRKPDFVGRRRELVEVARYIDPEKPTSRRATVIHGERGIGKTALATEITFRRGGWFDEIIWLQGRAEPVPRELAAHLEAYRRTSLVESLEEFFHRWASSLGLSPRGDEPPAALVKPVLEALAAEGKKRLLVLDNMDAFIGEDPVLDILRLLPANCRALVTCPYFPEGLDANRVELRGLAPAEAATLMLRHARRKGVPPDAAREVWERTGGHPLAMRLVIGWVESEKRTWGEALEELRRAKGDLFDYIFSRSLEMAGEDGRRLFRILALFYPVASREAWRAAADMPPGPFGDGVRLLVALSLVEDAGQVGNLPYLPYYALQPLARAVAERDLAEDGEQEEHRERMASYYRNWVEREAPTAPPQILEWEARNLRTALEWLDLKEGREVVEPLLDSLLKGVERAFDEGKRQWEEIRRRLEEAGVLLPPGVVVTPPGWEPLRGRLVSEFTEFCFFRSYWPQGERLLRPALEALETLGDRHGVAQTLNNLGLLLADQGRWGEAEEHYRRSLEIKEALGDRHGVAQVLGNLGSLYQLQGRWGEAEEHYRRSLEIKEALGDRHGVAQTLGNLGILYRLQGRWEEAEEHYRRSLEIKEALGDRHGVAQTLNNLGLLLANQGRWGEAEEHYRRSLGIEEALGDRHGVAQTLMNLGILLANQGRWEEAEECYRRSLEIKEALGDRHGVAQTLGNLGSLYLQQGRWGEAEEHYRRSLEIKEALGDRHGVAQTLMNLGSLYLQRGRWGEAEEHYRRSLETFEALGDRHGVAQTLMGLGILLANRGQWDEAEEHYRRSLETFEALGDRQGVAQTLGNLANLLYEQGRFDEALPYAREARRLLEGLGDAFNLATCYRLLACIHRARGEPEEAINSLAAALQLALSVHPKPVAEALDEIVRTARTWGEEGRWDAVMALGNGLLWVLEQRAKSEGREAKGLEREAWSEGLLWLCGAVCYVIAGVGWCGGCGAEGGPGSEELTALLKTAEMVDTMTAEVWKLAEWVRSACGL